MCGLYGWIRHPESPAPTLAVLTMTRTLCMLNEGRGDDGTGLAYPVEDKIKVVKAPVPATEFLMSEEAWTGVHKLPLWCLGHTRAATVGAHTVENTHPFVMGVVVGTHNGSVTNHGELPVDKDAYKLPDCDSAALFALIDQQGGKKALSQARGMLNLAYSIPPYDRVVLHQEYAKSLAIAYHKPWKMMIWSSDAEHLVQAMAVVGQLPHQMPGGRKDVTMIETEPGKLLTVIAKDLGSEELQWDRESVTRPTYAASSTTCQTRLPRYHGDYNYPSVNDFEDGEEWWNGHASTKGYPTTSSLPLKGGHRSIMDINAWHGGKQRECLFCTKLPPGITTRYQITLIKDKKPKQLYFTGPCALILCPNCKSSRLDRGMPDKKSWHYQYTCAACQAVIWELSLVGGPVHQPPRVPGLDHILPGDADAAAAC